MKGIRNIYRRLATLLCVALAGMNSVCWGQMRARVAVSDAWEQYDDWTKTPQVWDEDETSYWSLEKSTDNDRYHNNRIGFTFADGHIANIDYIEIVALGDESTRPTSVVVSKRPNGGSGETWYKIQEFDLNDDGRTWIDVSDYISFGDNAYLNLMLTFINDHYSGENETNIYEIYFYRDIENTYYEINSTVHHKPAKWHDLREDLHISTGARALDDFDDGKEFFTESDYARSWGLRWPEGTRIQAAHTLIETIYTHKGETVELVLPDRMNNTGDVTTVGTYQRWYDFQTDGTFNKVDGAEILLPSTGPYTKMGNGYVHVNESKEYQNTPTVMNFHFPKNEQNFYIVACDVSGYTDFTEKFEQGTSNQSLFWGGGCWEPTLTHRILYYIHAIEDTNSNDYKILTSSDADTYLEDYVIHMPATRLPNKTNELIALARNARDYAIPGSNRGTALKVELEANTNTADISLASGADANARKYSTSSATSITISGTDRCIYLLYPDTNSDKTQSVKVDEDGTAEATILVTKDGYRIARFRLVFSEESRLLTQSQINTLNNSEDAGTDATGWRALTYRTPESLNNNSVYELLTELNFDYDPEVAQEYGKPEVYPFPLGWDDNSYGFYDGSPDNDYVGVHKYPEWGNYAILNDFLESDIWAWGTGTDAAIVKRPAPIKNSQNVNSRYHLFVDASDRPGVIARLPFDDKLCQGSELFVSAWVKCTRWATKSDNAAMLFTIMGVEADGTMHPIYRYQTGQIPTTYLNDKSLSVSGFNENGTTVDKESSPNEWLQLYFSFINDTELDYPRYVLQVENNSASTNGGDMYLDDIRIYMATPSAEVRQLEASCASERTRMSMKLDWERLLSRTGGQGLDAREAAIDFCFVDQMKFNQVYNGTNIEEALEASVESIGDGTDYNAEFATIYYKLNYRENANYNTVTDPDGPLAKNNKEGDKYYAYRLTENGLRSLAVDFYAYLSPNRLYWMLIHVRTDDGATVDASTFADFLTDCAIKTEFRVTGLNLVKVNGNILQPDDKFCAGNIFDFSVDLRVPIVDESGKEEDYQMIEHGIYFDWFFGTEEDYIMKTYPDEGETPFTLQEAITAFREFYKDAEKVDETTPAGVNKEVGGVTVTFTQAMFDLLWELSQPQTGASGNLHPQLVLHKENLNITLLSTGLDLVIQPIRTDVPPESLGGFDEKLWARICWDYMYLPLEAEGAAPEAFPGINSLQYPHAGFIPNVRIGLEQIYKVSNHARYENDNKSLRIELQEIKVTSDDISHIGPTDQESLRYIYLIDTNDPDMEAFIAAASEPGEGVEGATFDPYSLPAGWLTALYGEPYETGGQYDNYMDIRFDLEGAIDKRTTDFQFVPREGYYYRFMVPFQEKLRNSEASSNTCFGQLNFTLLVVPEYLVWEDSQKAGSTIGNWNYDGNWKRADKDRLLKEENDSYLTNDANETSNGFVPMLFSKVIMPRDSKIHLYAAGYTNNIWGGNDQRPSTVAEPTENIQYDLMTYEHRNGGNMTTERYRVALCDEIHFEPGAEMLYAEYLLYNKAWVDYELADDRWHLLASPLQGVVAGDFYAPTSGRQETEYFQPIHFGSGYNRFEPSVYQRGWKNSTTEVNLYTGGSNNPKNVAISGNWSSLYNDVDEAYTPGTGFSLKVQDLAEQANGQALFRLPKADGSYSYYNKDEETGDNLTTINRTNPGRLMSDKIYHRTETSTSYGGSVSHDTITVTISESANDEYYLVGNPFMAHLDMEAFFDGNTNLQRTYWLVDNDSQTVATGTEEDLTSNNSNADNTVAPLQSFFVKLGENQTAPVNITFTHDMQVLGGTSDGLRSTSNVLYITATTQDGRTSRAAVAYDAMTSDDYQPDEDAELFLDSNLGDVPMVYTVAGTMATSINMRPTCEQVPLGVYGTRDEEVTLRFEGTEAFGGVKLYDARTGQATALRESTELRVATNDYGRYYLIGGVPTGTESIHSGNDIEIYSIRPGEIVVTTTGSPLRTVCVYGVNGALVARQSLANQSVYRLAVPGNALYMIYAEDAEGIIRNVKMRVR